MILAPKEVSLFCLLCVVERCIKEFEDEHGLLRQQKEDNEYRLLYQDI
jgi:hypothetical protein